MSAGSIPHSVAQYLNNCRKLPFEARVALYNEMTGLLRDMVGLDHPVLAVKLVKPTEVQSNDYNPNRVAPPEMKLLELSMQKDGVTMPVVAAKNDKGTYVIVDGFHRTQVIKYYPPVCDALQGYVPLVELNKGITDRIAATVRHNVARGSHKTGLVARLVALLKKNGWTDEKIGREIGMEPDEVLRLKQLTGLSEVFADQEFSKSWE
ncbi:MAG: ParB/RepB/Spo0J family partition protein [Alphaproteobacteria bacterium]